MTLAGVFFLVLAAVVVHAMPGLYGVGRAAAYFLAILLVLEGGLLVWTGLVRRP